MKLLAALPAGGNELEKKALARCPQVESATCLVGGCCTCPPQWGRATLHAPLHYPCLPTTAHVLGYEGGCTLSLECYFSKEKTSLLSTECASSAQSWLLDAQPDSSTAGACGRHPCHGCSAIAWLLTRLPLHNIKPFVVTTINAQ